MADRDDNSYASLIINRYQMYSTSKCNNLPSTCH
uniref:Uncharacterized protein n=1 Tax=Rhizophora mucronata TaxID=61149 RepID=A0A2P2Q8L0_RHIMU